MRWNDRVRAAMVIAQQIPDDIYFDIETDGTIYLHAETQEQVHARMRALALPRPWRKQFCAILKKWEYHNITQDIGIAIIGVSEAPPSCTARYEERRVEKRVPVEYKTELVTERVLVGYDCPREEP